MSTGNTELFEGVGSVMPITRACNQEVGQELEEIGKDWKENGWDEDLGSPLKSLTTEGTGIHGVRLFPALFPALFSALCLYPF
jgi:hypothetical protein